MRRTGLLVWHFQVRKGVRPAKRHAPAISKGSLWKTYEGPGPGLTWSYLWNWLVKQQKTNVIVKDVRSALQTWVNCNSTEINYSSYK